MSDKPMSTPKKCEAILKAVLALAYSEKPVTFSEDWGDYTLTVSIGAAHTHVGLMRFKGDAKNSGTWKILVDQLHSTLTGGPGLSWHEPTKACEVEK